MIKISKLTKEYNGQKVVDNLSLEVKRGSIFGFLGPNGAGKTTTIKMIIGLSKPTSGKITMGKKKLDRNIIGYMPEDPYFYERLNAKEFLKFVYDLFRQQVSSRAKSRDLLSSQKISPTTSLARNDKIAEVLKLVGLENTGKKPIGEFSKGMKQRLGLAQAIINGPEYLFLDEPLDGLDPIGRLEFKKVILDLKKNGKTIFLNSHILSDVEEICDEIGILNKGKLLYSGDIKTFCGGKSLEKAFVERIKSE